MEEKEIAMGHRILTRVVTTALGVSVLGALGALASGDQAKPRGQSGGTGSSGGGVRQHSPSGGSSSSNSGRSSGSHGGYSGGSSRPRSSAENRHPRAGTGTGYRGYGYGYGSGYPPYYYSPGWGYWYNPGYYSGYYYGHWPYWGGGLGYGAGGYWGGGYSSGGYYGAPYYRSGHDSDAAALRLLIDPEDAKVYVDGYYAGEVDDFDGLMQRLSLAPGRHEILLKKDGYRTHRVKVYLESGTTVKLRHGMEKGTGPDTLEDLAGERGLEEERRRSARRAEEESEEDGDVLGAPRSQPRENAGPNLRLPAPSPEGSATPGLLALRVSPEDASVYVDGRFFGSARQTGEIELSPGPHRVEIVRPGYKTVERDVVIEAGRTLTLGMALDRP